MPEKKDRSPVKSSEHISTDSIKLLYTYFDREFKKDFETIKYLINEVVSNRLSDQNWISGILEGSISFFLYYIFQNFLKIPHENLVFLTVDDLSASRLYEELVYLQNNISGEPVQGDSGNIFFFPSWGILPFTYSKPDSRKEAERARTLSNILSDNKKKIIITSVDALVQKIPDRNSFEEKALKFNLFEKYDFNLLSGFLTDMGYEKTDIVQNYGQYCVKGNIVDIFSPLYLNPVRLDFFGDDLERIVMFDPDTQKSMQSLQEANIFPCHDLTINEKDLEKLGNELFAFFRGKDFMIPPIISTREMDERESGGLWDIFPLIYKTSSFLDFLKEGKEKSPDHSSILLSWEDERILERLNKIEDEIVFLRNRSEKKIMLDKNELFLSSDEFQNIISRRMKLSVLPKKMSGNPAKSPDETNLEMRHSPVYKGRVSGLIDDVKKGAFQQKKIFISVKSKIQLDRLQHILSGYGSGLADLYVIEAPFDTGFETRTFVLITEKDLFGKSSRINKIQKSATSAISSFSDLKSGDYVVHINYGIGQFKALRRMSVAGFERDFIEIEYSEKNKLYVPIEQLHFVHKYIGSTDTPVLDHLGKKSGWSKTKSKVSESLQKMALELLEIYARRENARGIIYPSDSRFQEEFEAAFPFEETEHQLQAIHEVKKDMESERPMDRLICGDVGFGKTEIAIRAAFKAVMAGRQVCILCPTTILAFQHYNNFCKRFENYPVKIEMMSRFKTSSELTKIKNDIKNGEVDIVIGTHAVLNKQMHWKNLGLLVVDEEQRFGVKHKEHIKNFKANVDCLTMTATPIPRTLQMSMVGIRDLSIIETPPRNRLKTETYVLEDNDDLLIRAIKKELERDGQVIILHNKVQTIEIQAARIKNLVPEADILVLHGQMTEDEIETRTLDFYSKKFHVLLSTTIIESGIDLPDANTLIVLNSQNFGLSQLYQIKGRVGRSDRQAYAYFFYPPAQVMTEKSQKRLNTLMEYDGLGDGFKIAMKDLEIRGAGNILGAEQSGDIMAVGFELYVNMLHEKLAELKNEVKAEDFECAVIVPQDYYIPDDYISDIRQKMEFYKKLTSVTSFNEMDDLTLEISDRFGKPPETVESMFYQEKLRLAGKKLRFEKIVVQNSVISLTASPTLNLDMQRVVKLIQNDKRFFPDSKNPRQMNFIPNSKNTGESLREINAVLEFLL
ncbi:MAG: transcription-repair coupling factor [Spirochaetia bacterium]|nr:transcription-repair coupling factor [Spirochaetia bacterium]